MGFVSYYIKENTLLDAFIKEYKLSFLNIYTDAKIKFNCKNNNTNF